MRALAQFGDQPRILHRDHCLGREILQQCDLLVGERPHLLAVGRHVAEERAILAERDKEHRPGTLHFSGSAGNLVILGSQVGDMDEALPT